MEKALYIIVAVVIGGIVINIIFPLVMIAISLFFSSLPLMTLVLLAFLIGYKLND